MRPKHAPDVERLLGDVVRDAGRELCEITDPLDAEPAVSSFAASRRSVPTGSAPSPPPPRPSSPPAVWPSRHGPASWAAWS